MKKFLIVIIFFILTLSFAFLLQNLPENKGKFETELLYFPSGKMIKEISLDYKTTLTNIMWFQIIQYYGQHLLTDRKLDHLYKLFDAITQLDSNFLQCYIFGGTVITYDMKKPDLGMAILKKGMVNLPTLWQIPFIQGFLYYVYFQDYEKSYRWFLFSSTKKDAPYYCKTFAAASKKKEGDYITAIKLWNQIYDNSNNRFEKQKAINNIITILKEIYKKKVKEGENQFQIMEEFKKIDFISFQFNIKFFKDSISLEVKD